MRSFEQGRRNLPQKISWPETPCRFWRKRSTTIDSIITPDDDARIWLVFSVFLIDVCWGDGAVRSVRSLVRRPGGKDFCRGGAVPVLAGPTRVERYARWRCGLGRLVRRCRSGYLDGSFFREKFFSPPFVAASFREVSCKQDGNLSRSMAGGINDQVLGALLCASMAEFGWYF